MTKRVLIVDDDKWLVETFQAVLESHDWEVRVCHDAHAAIDVIDEWVPSVILLDVLLPYASGVGLLHELQSHDDTRVLPVVMCSSLELDISYEPYGIYAFLDKSTMSPSLLIDTLEGARRAVTQD